MVKILGGLKSSSEIDFSGSVPVIKMTFGCPEIDLSDKEYIAYQEIDKLRKAKSKGGPVRLPGLTLKEAEVLTQKLIDGGLLAPSSSTFEIK